MVQADREFLDLNGGSGLVRLPYAPGQTDVNRTLKFQIGRAETLDLVEIIERGGAHTYAQPGDGGPGTHGGGGGGGIFC